MRKILCTAAAAVMLFASACMFAACGGEGEETMNEGPEEQVQTLPEISVITDLADERYVNLYGRNFEGSEGEGMTLINSAAGFEVRFRGTTLTMRVRGVTTLGGFDKAMFSVFVDGETDSNARIVSLPLDEPGFEELLLAQGLSEGEHTVKVLKRTPSNRDKCYVKNVSTDGAFLAAPQTPEIKLDVYGDSITVGSGVLRTVTYDAASGKYVDSAQFTPETQNVFQSYAGVAARELGAELRVFGRGGIALKYSSNAYTVLNNYKSMAVDLSAARGDCPEYDYSSWTPSAVVLYLGTNDYNFGRSNPSLGYSSEGMRDAVVQFVNEVVGQYYGKEMPVFLCAGMMVPYSGLDQVMEQAKRILKFDYPNVETVIFDACAIDHPVAAESEVAGKKLADAIREMLGLGS